MHTVKKKRDIPYGVINWAQLVRECLFVDNTAYIRNLERVRTPVFLRPKRFGKSVVCSMLAHYYDVSLKDRSILTVVVEVCGNVGYNWFDLP